MPSYGSIRGVSSRGSGVAGTRITVLGVNECIAKFNLIGSVAGRETGLITYKRARATEELAQANVHVVEGHIKNGIRAVKIGFYDWMVTASSVDGGAEKEYAAYEEYGWSGLPGGHPFLRPAFAAQLILAKRDMYTLARRLMAL